MTTTQRIAVNGLHLNVERHGAPNAPLGALLLLHGFTGSAAGWGAHLTTLAAAGLHVIALDLHGHGASDAPTDPARYAIEHASDDILTLLHALDLSPTTTTLLGYSMGGRIALHTALSTLSTPFRALILESASAGLPDPADRATRRASDAALATRIERDGLPAFIAYWETIPLFASQRALPPAQRAALHEQRLHNTPHGLANSLRGVGTGSQPALHQPAAHLTTPTLLLAGALDTKYSALASELATILPNATLRIIPDAGHTIHLEQPATFDAAVIAFQRSLAAPIQPFHTVTSL